MDFKEQLNNLASQCHDNTIIITPNQRLKTYLLNEIEATFYDSAWTTPKLLSLSEWLTETYQSYIFQKETNPLLLSQIQAHYILQQITSTEADSFISNIQTITDKLFSAWEYLKLWNIPIDEIKQYTQEDYQWFIRVAAQFEKHLTQHKYITPAQLPDFLLKNLAWMKQITTNQLLFFGFDEITPQISRLCEKIKLNHVNIEFITFNTPAKQIKAHAFINKEEEIEQMTNWAYEHYRQGKKRIACIIPELLTHRKTIFNAFAKKFYQNHFFTTQQLKAPFSITGGEPLSDFPLIRTVLAVLKCAQYRIDFSTINYMILSPYIGEATNEHNERSLFAEKIREHVFLEVSLKQVISLLNNDNSCPNLLQQLQIIQSFNINQFLSINSWIMKISSLLKKLQWPGDRTLSSNEYQQLTKFDSCLKLLSSLNFLSDNMSFTKFLNLLITKLNSQLFQPENETSPVQILGILEAAGQQFDTIWFMDLTDEHWPTNANPNPFIPAEIQRKYKLPHANAERELQFAQNIQTRFMQSCHEIIFSWSENSENTTNQASALIRPYIMTYQMQSVDSITAHKNLPVISFNDTIPITSSEFAADSYLIKKQAECPFQAFAHYRLKAKAFDKINFITSKKHRGILLHYVLQNFWQSYSGLVDLKKNKFKLNDTLLEQTKKYVHKYYQSIYIDNSDFIALESQRIYQVLNNWLEVELARDDFDIYEIEKSHTLFIDKLKLRLRVDRVDQLHNGNLIIIDYKTGLSSEKKWLDSNFVEPQLPIYCLLFPHQVVGLAFAQLHAESITFKGLTIENASLPGIEKQKNITGTINQFISNVTGQECAISSNNYLTLPEMFSLQHAWKLKIQDIANNFLQGVNQPQPINQQICTFCQRESLCRVHNIKRIFTQ